MAFRRRFKRRFPLRRRGPPLARVRRNWLTSLVPTVCDPLEIPLHGCPTEVHPEYDLARIVLVSQATLDSQYSDRAKLVRIVGDLWMNLTWDDTSPSTPIQQFIAAVSAYGQAFVGLRKYQVNGLGAVLPVYPITFGGPADDYSDAQWYRTWQHMWIPTSEVTYLPQITTQNCGVAICSDTHTTGLTDNIFVEGTGTINIETDCGEPQTVECNSVQPDFVSQNARFPIPWHLKLDVKKRIALRENEEIALEFQFMLPTALAGGNLVNPRVQVFGGIKSLLQF